jgi:hypothetical protein
MTWYLLLVLCAAVLACEACFLLLLDALEGRR